MVFHEPNVATSAGINHLRYIRLYLVSYLTLIVSKLTSTRASANFNPLALLAAILLALLNRPNFNFKIWHTVYLDIVRLLEQTLHLVLFHDYNTICSRQTENKNRVIFSDSAFFLLST